MAANRALRDRNNAEGFSARERRQDAAFGDAEDGPVRCFAADTQTGIAVAGDDEGGRTVVAFYQTAQRHHHAVDVGLALDPVRAFGERLADDLRSTLKAERLQGVLQPLCNEMVGIGIDDENARPGHCVFLRDDEEAMTMPSSDASSAVRSESARACGGTICAFIQ